MKPLFTSLLLLCNVLIAAAQWSNTSNDFINDHHMPVCTASGDQTHVMVIASAPDNAYFVIWEDRRNGAAANGQIYAQKYDPAGNRLWAPNGVVISAGTNHQQFVYSSNQDYRQRRFAASDRTGGLYITYTDDSLANGVWKRICVQHIKSDGSKVFAGAGGIMAQTSAGQTVNYHSPQLMADNDGGFYLAYISANNSIGDYLYLQCYKDENGVMTLYGGGRANENLVGIIGSNVCGTGFKFDMQLPGTTVTDYNIWPDLQGNCSVVMSMYGNTASQGNMLCYNKAWKVKQDQTVSIAKFLADGSPTTETIDYKKGEVDLLYKARFDARNEQCKVGTNTYTWIDYHVVSQGFQVVDKSEVAYFGVKGATLATGGNINAELVTANSKTVVNNTATDPCVIAIGFTDEIYTSVPYPRASNSNPLLGFNTAKPADLDSLSYFRDTLLGTAVSAYDYSLASGGSHAYLSALLLEKLSDNAPQVRLQHVSTAQIAAGQYAIQFNTSGKNGETIGREVKTGFGVTEIDYDLPLVTAHATGNALFTINELGRYTRVSPIFNNAQLAWGAMGKPLGTPMVNGSYINPTDPMVAIDASGGKGLIGWNDQRNVNTSAWDVFVRHLDNLLVASYAPPNKKVMPLPAGSSTALPMVLTGVSKKYGAIEVFHAAAGAVSPVVELSDDYNLGSVTVGVFENAAAVRLNNGKPYLDRNYTITPQNNPNGVATINVRLYFTTAEMDALKLADPSVTGPGSLIVIKQPNTTGIVPASLVLSGSETELVPIDWQAVDGGYYLEVAVNSFSNFFIQKASAVLPVTWLGVQAQWLEAAQAKISWQVGDQQDVKEYIVQESADGVRFTNKCTVVATAASTYSCTIPVYTLGTTFYRVLQRDANSQTHFSKTVALQPIAVSAVQMYPNPARNSVFVQVARNGVLRVTDLNGRQILQQIVVTGSNAINISMLRTGIYMLSVTSNGDSKVIQLIKE